MANILEPQKLKQAWFVRVSLLWVGLMLSGCGLIEGNGSGNDNDNDNEPETVNRAPIAQSESVTVSVGSNQANFNASDPDGDALQVEIVRTPQWGTLVLFPGTAGSAGSFRYFVGLQPQNDSFDYRVSDGLLQSETATVTLNFDSSGLDPDPDPDATLATSVVGKFRYERVSPVCSADLCSLDYDNTTFHPIRGARVVLLNEGLEAIAENYTTNDGGYVLEPTSMPEAVRVQVISQSQTPPITVEDNTSQDANGTDFLYAGTSELFFPAEGESVDLDLPLGWDDANDRYFEDGRVSAPFALLDSAYEAAQKFLSERPTAVFPEVKINWSKNNIPAPGSNAEGRITTSKWDGTELFILGQDGVDTDEYDAHVVVHEWGHYFETNLSRSDSPGGPHGFGEVIDARLAFGEGWANALAGMVLGNPIYVDTFGAGQSTAGGYSLETPGPVDPKPGWFSEASVQSIVFDMMDDSGTNESFDGLAIGFGGLYDIMTGPQKRSEFLTTIFSFAEGARSTGVSSALLNPILQDRSVEITSASGASAHHVDGDGDAKDEDFFTEIEIGNQVVFSLEGPKIPNGSGGITVNNISADANHASHNKFFYFTGDDRNVDILVTASDSTGEFAADVDIFLFGSIDGNDVSLLGRSEAGCTTSGGLCLEASCLPPYSDGNSFSCIDGFSNFPAEAGKVYALVVTGFHFEPVSYPGVLVVAPSSN